MRKFIRIVEHQNDDIEMKIQRFLESIKLDFTGKGFPIKIFDNTVIVSLAQEQISLEQLEKIKMLGENILVSAHNGYSLEIEFTLHDGLNIIEN